MAFNNIMQFSVSALVRQGYFSKNPKVIELGNQRFRYDEKWIEYCSKISGKKISKSIDFVWEFYGDLGFREYSAIDVNTELKSIPMDLNFVLSEKYNFNKAYDLVTNNGTGEHIFDQKVVFENIHNLCKVGGVMIHVLPFSPWINHGFYNFNPNLFRDLVAANEYEWCFFFVAQNIGNYIKCPTEMNSWTFYEQKKPLNPFSDLEKALEKLHNRNVNPQNVSIVAAFKKILAKPFSVPMQGRYVNDLNDDLKKEYKDTNLDVRQKDHKSSNY